MTAEIYNHPIQFFVSPGIAALAVDGIINPTDTTCSITEALPNSWLAIDLGQITNVAFVQITVSILSGMQLTYLQQILCFLYFLWWQYH